MTNLSQKNILSCTILVIVLLIGFSVSSPVAQSATTPGGLDTIHELNSLSVDLSVAETPGGVPLNGQLDDNTNGTITYNVTVNAENKADVYPYIYPVRINYTTPDRSGFKRSDTVYLTPTRSDGYIPDPAPDKDVEERNIQTKFQITVPYPGVTDDSIVARTLEVTAESRFTNDRVTKQITSDVEGPVASSVTAAFVENRRGLDEPSTTTFVDTYRISPSSDSSTFQESSNLPIPSKGGLAGSVDSFPSMKQPSEGATTITGDTSGLSFVTLTRNLETGDAKDSPVPQTLAITYSIETGNSDIVVSPLNPGGEEINEEIEYRLPENPTDSEDCRPLEGSSAGNLCIFTLDQSETKVSNRLGEILLQYEAGSSTTAAVYCQSVISGYMTSDSRACGVEKSVTGPDVITIEEFEGYHPPDEPPDYVDDTVTVQSTNIDGSATELNMRLDPQVTLAEGASNVDVKWEIYDMGELANDGTIGSSSPKFDGTFDAKDSSTQITESVSNVEYSDLTKEYKAVLCPATVSCTEENKYDSESLQFVTSESSIPILVTRDATELLEVDTTTPRVVGEKRLETTDPGYDDPSWSEWQCVRGTGCPRDSSDEQFTGDIEQTVIVEDVYGSQLNRVQNNEIISRAETLRADLQGGEWNPNPDYRPIIEDVNPQEQVAYATSPPEGVRPDGSLVGGWERVSGASERTAQTGTTTKYFSIQRGVGFSSVVESESQWYPLRGSKASPGSAPDNPGLEETVYQYEDPDDCLNCLPAENVSEARDRFSNTPSVTLTQTEVGSIWDNPGDGTAVRENTLREDYAPTEITAGERASPAKVFDNVTPSDTGDFLYRTSEYVQRDGKNRIPIREWVSQPEIPKVEFERPQTEPVYKYRRTVADARYTFRGKITTPSELYEYSKVVEEEASTYKENPHWFDISESRTDGSGRLGYFRFIGDNAQNSDGYKIEWANEVHNNTEPTEHPTGDRNNLTRYCDTLGSGAGYGDLVEKEIGEQFHGEGGRVVVDTCPDSTGGANTDKIVRIGKYYDTPRESGPYKERFELYAKGGGSRDVDTYNVDVQGKDVTCDPSGCSSGGGGDEPVEPADPYIDSIGLINDKADYKYGIVAINGQIGSITEELPGDGSYRLTVQPSDDVDTIGECSEIGRDENKTYQVQDQRQSGDTIREVVQCEVGTFYNFDKVREKFVHYTKESTENNPNIEFQEIPEGAIQDCLDPLTASSSGDSCVNESGNVVEFGGKNDPSSSAPNSLQSVPGERLGTTCPDGYEYGEPEQISEGVEEYSCVLSVQPQFELKSRQITVTYNDVRSGVIKEDNAQLGDSDYDPCARIPTTSEDDSNPHAGYESVLVDEDVKCQIKDPSDPGPESFIFRDPDASDSNDEYNQIPAGAVRGNTTSYENVPARCNTVKQQGDNNALICNYDTGSGVDIAFGSKTYGDWLSTSSTVAQIEDQSSAEKTVWTGSAVLDANEQFTTTINPRATSYDQSTPGSTVVEFNFKLRDSDNDVIDTKTVDVKLCKARTLTSADSLPLEDYSGCENFDTLIDGTDDLVDDPTDDSNNLNNVQSALENVPNTGTNQYTIDTMANDACPYNRKYPRQHSQLRSEVTGGGIQITLDGDSNSGDGDTAQDIERKVRQQLQSRYPTLGTLCEDDYDKVKAPSRLNDKEYLRFSRNTFSETVSSDTSTRKRFVRSASLYDLKLHTRDPSQTGENWRRGELRLGSPVIGNISAQGSGVESRLELVAHYPFDHDPTEPTVGARPRAVSPNQYVVQDVYHQVLQNVNTGVEGSSRSVGNIYPDVELTGSISSIRRDNHVYQSRLWYGSPCNTGADNGAQKMSHPQSLDGIVQDKVSKSCGFTKYEDDSSGGETTESLFERDRAINNNVLTDTQYSAGRLTTYEEKALDNQAAFLYAPPAAGVPNSVSDGNSEPYDATEYLKRNYDESGVFAGKSLQLDSSSWLMVTPPCMDKTKFEGGSLSDVEFAGDNLYNGNCVSDPSSPEYNPSAFRGGYADAYQTDSREVSQSLSPGYDTIYDNITEGDDNSYTVSFWVKDSVYSPDSTKKFGVGDNGLPPSDGSLHPFNTLYSASIPAHGIRRGGGNTAEGTNDQGTGNKNLQSTARLSIMRTPTSIDVSDIDSSGISRLDNNEEVNPKDGWAYKTDTNLRSRFENCILWSSTNNYGDRPVSCDIWYETSDILNGRNPDIEAPGITTTDRGLSIVEDMRNNPNKVPSEATSIQDPDIHVVEQGDDYTYNELYSDFSEKVFERVNWRWSYEYPVSAHSVRRTQDHTTVGGGYAGSNIPFNDFPVSYRPHAPSSCPTAEASRTEDPDPRPVSTFGNPNFIYHSNNCYEDSTYLFKSESAYPKNISPTPTHYGDDWTHVTLSYADDRSSRASDPRRRGRMTVYINGKRASSSVPPSITDCTEIGTPEDTRCAGNGATVDNDIEFDGTGIDTGKLYEDSVISIGAQYQHAGYTTDVDSEEALGNNDGQYIPMIRGSDGENILIDDLRIYKGNVSAAHSSAVFRTFGDTAGTLVEEQIPLQSPIQFPNDDYSTDNYYKGKLETSIQKEEELGSIRVENAFQDSGAVRVETVSDGNGYVEIGVVPCDGTTCYDGAEAEVSNRVGDNDFGSPSLNGKLGAFDLGVLETSGVSMSDIDGIKIKATLASESMEQSPSISIINIQPVPKPFDSCQAAMEEYKSFSGNRDVTIDTLVNGEQTELQCDFETQDGGWTKFAWFDSGEVTNTDGVDSIYPLSNNIELSDCESDAEECGSTPDFEPPSNVDYDNYEDASGPEDLNGQLLIKAKKNGRTIDWAAIEMDQYANYKDVEDKRSSKTATEENKETLATNSTMNWATELSLDLQTSDDTVDKRTTYGDWAGEPDSDRYTASSSSDIEVVNNCLYPFGHGDNYTDSNGRCLTNYKHTAISPDSGLLRLSQVQKQDVSGSTNYESQYDYITVDTKIVDGDLVVNNLECLEKSSSEIDKCELYYSTGSAINTSNEPSGTTGSPSARLNIEDLKNHWTANSGSVDFTQGIIEDTKGSADLENADAIAPSQGLDGDTNTAVDFGTGTQSYANEFSDYSVDENRFAVAGHMSVDTSGTREVFSISKDPNVGVGAGTGGTCGQSCAHNSITITNADGNNIEASFEYIIEGAGTSGGDVVEAVSLSASSSNVDPSRMNHVAFVWNGGDADEAGKLYVNGNLADTADVSDDISQQDIRNNGPIKINRPSNTNDGQVRLGGEEIGAGSSITSTYDGRVDDWLVVSGGTLDKCQIETLAESRYNSNPETKCST